MDVSPYPLHIFRKSLSHCMGLPQHLQHGGQVQVRNQATEVARPAGPRTPRRRNLPMLAWNHCPFCASISKQVISL